ncbi:cytochrome c oxidase subunit II [Scytonema sp. HK-05]|uniref:cytochrome c oxidase subunit II n=1 Tax=Scytonema sp. HK-05 TaxID=1137095 RepID=UPI0009373B83|nr:cytochrome c oxidase subunit II [Scytonema sp. HK-05]OKH58055.1 cytochrome C oxidase subunit II [Scytonema sp. HK-05]BAY47570.1 cytochrome c oxidase subunit II [Scytonema sp. HK-05]
MRKILNTLLLAAFIAAILIASRWLGQQAYSWMPAQATAEAKRVDEIFSFLVSVGAFIFLGLTGIIVYSLLTCRAPKGDWSHGHPARNDVRLEILWTVTPTLLVLWLATQSYKIYQQLDILGLTQVVHLHIPIEEPAYAVTVSENIKPVAQNIEVVAKQWVWSFRYPGNVTSNELHLQLNQRTRLDMHSEDVIHGFYVPEFRLKQDIVPNRNIEIVLAPTREGKYKLSDSQFSGTDFALMQADVYVDSPQAYNQWLSQAAAGKSTPQK